MKWSGQDLAPSARSVALDPGDCWLNRKQFNPAKSPKGNTMTRTIPTYMGQYDLDTSNETWNLNEGSTITSASGNGINEASFRSNNIINVNGSIAALSSQSAGVNLQGENSSVTAGNNAVIDAWHGIQLFGHDQSVVNNGTLNVMGRGIYSQHDDNSITNNGVIKAHASAQADVDGIYANNGGKFVNGASGEIDVTGYGLSMQATVGAKTLVTNLGSVTADKLGYYGGAGDDKFVNRGMMDGDVAMNSGNDTFDGTGGMLQGSVMGGANDDLYIIDKTSYKLYEKANEGDDTVQSKATWTLGKNFEDLKLTGTSSINGKGNDLGNDITGNAKANTLSGLGGKDDLDGGKGNDILTGGKGDDVFHFAKGYGKDTITDFSAGHDAVDLSHLSGVDNFDDLMKHHVKVSGDDLVISAGSDHLILEDTKKSELDTHDFNF
jgi:Ca2+-binding RTX toxin-like protein